MIFLQNCFYMSPQIRKFAIVFNKALDFNIYNSKDAFIKTITTNTSGEAELTLPYGKYKLIQLTTTEGYQKVEPIEFEINEENIELSYNLQNYKIDVPNTFSTTLFKKIINFLLNSFNAVKNSSPSSNNSFFLAKYSSSGKSIQRRIR